MRLAGQGPTRHTGNRANVCPGGRRDWLVLDDNPLSEESVNVHIPALLERGVAVSFDGVRLATQARGDPVQFEVGAHFAAILGEGLRIGTKVRDPALAYAEIADGRLTVRPGASGGRATVTVTGTDEDQRSATVTFSLTLRGAVFASIFPPAADPVRQGFMRVINPTVASESLDIDAFDQRGTRRGPATLTVALAGDRHLVPIFNPGSNRAQVSLLRLVNPGTDDARVAITGIDDEGNRSGNVTTTRRYVLRTCARERRGCGGKTGRRRRQVAPHGDVRRTDPGDEPAGEPDRSSDEPVDGAGLTPAL